MKPLFSGKTVFRICASFAALSFMAVNPLPAQTAAAPDTVLLLNQNQVFSITKETPFYDAGGPAGGVQEGDEGSVTFVPATQGQVIQLDFSHIDIFNSDYGSGITTF